MTTFIKHSDQPLTYQFSVEENLAATFSLDGIDYTANVSENSAKITLNLRKTADVPSTFQHTFLQAFVELSGASNIPLSISLANEDGHILTHQEAGTHIERPLPGSF